MNPGLQLWHGDCLTEMDRIPDGSADCIITDLPYGVTACAWDSIIPFAPLWAQYKRVAKRNAAIVLFGSQPFTSALVMSNAKDFRYEWIWYKPNRLTNFGNANRMPLKGHENIAVFYGSLPTYNPQRRAGTPYQRPRGYCGKGLGNTRLKDGYITISDGGRFPHSVIEAQGSNSEREYHPNQKPVSILKYLIRTYTNEGETVLDSCMGSGSCGVAAVETRRRFIGIELDSGYFEIARRRIAQAAAQEVLPL